MTTKADLARELAACRRELAEQRRETARAESVGGARALRFVAGFIANKRYAGKTVREFIKNVAEDWDEAARLQSDAEDGQ
jgi:hypothetical protein